MLTPKKIRTSTLQEFKNVGQKFACLTSYDFLTAGIFDECGIEVLLVGDSAADNHLGYDSTLPITIDEVIPFGRAVAKAASRSLVVVDMPFGSYEVTNEHALENAIRLLKTTGAAAVKLEGGVRSAERIRALTEAGIPVMGHIGFTPQSIHQLGGFKVQGRGDAAEKLFEDAKAVEAAGAFAVVLELVPAELATQLSKELAIPTIGIGAGAGCDGQILVWTDFAGLTPKARKFVKRYAELRETLSQATRDYHREVIEKTFPASEHEFN